MTTGRPPRQLTEEEYKNIEEWMFNGKSFKQIARLLRISREGLYDMMDRDKRLSDTILQGKQDAEAWWEEMGQENLANKNFNYQGWFMNMKNRFKWCERTEATHTVSVDDSTKKVRDADNQYSKEF
jgi:hypothetical protein